MRRPPRAFASCQERRTIHGGELPHLRGGVHGGGHIRVRIPASSRRVVPRRSERAEQAPSAGRTGDLFRRRGLHRLRLAPPDSQVPLGWKSTGGISGKEQFVTEGRVTVPSLRDRKRRNGEAPIVMVTAYDEPSARIVDSAGVVLLLGGVSVANNFLGYEDALHVTIDDMERHVSAVARAKPRCLIVGDMPWM